MSDEQAPQTAPAQAGAATLTFKKAKEHKGGVSYEAEHPEGKNKATVPDLYIRKSFGVLPDRIEVTIRPL